MKKSNALMLSYIIFLVSTIIAHVFFNWKGLDRTALATTVAGCFFAISDYYGWRASFEKACYEKFRELRDILLEFNKIQLDTIETENHKLSNTIDTFSPYSDENKDIASLLVKCKDILNENNERKMKVQATITEFDDMEQKITKGLQRSDTISKIGMGCAVLGFILFFMVIAFDYFVFIITPYQAIITIIAFAIIMFTYYRKDVHEEKWEQELAEMKKQAEESKQCAIKANEKINQCNIEESLEKFRKIKEQNP